MMTVQLSYDDAEARALLRRLETAGIAGARSDRVVAEAGADLTREHLRKLSRSRHRAGVAQDFYGRASDAVVGGVVSGGAEVAIAHEGLRLRWRGGTVRPSGRVSLVTGRPIRRLAIPMSGTRAEGRAVGEFSDLTLVVTRRKKAFLAQRRANGVLTFLFSLQEQTTHKADPTVIPDDDAFRAAALGALSIFVEEAANG